MIKLLKSIIRVFVMLMGGLVAALYVHAGYLVSFHPETFNGFIALCVGGAFGLYFFKTSYEISVNLDTKNDGG